MDGRGFGRDEPLGHHQQRQQQQNMPYVMPSPLPEPMTPMTQLMVPHTLHLSLPPTLNLFSALAPATTTSPNALGTNSLLQSAFIIQCAQCPNAPSIRPSSLPPDARARLSCSSLHSLGLSHVPVHCTPYPSLSTHSREHWHRTSTTVSAQPPSPVHLHPLQSNSHHLCPRNIVSTVNLGCKLDLKKIALHARNAEYNPKVGTATHSHLNLSLPSLSPPALPPSSSCSDLRQ